MDEYEMIRPFGLRVAKSSDRGKCLHTTTRIEKGAEFLIEAPLFTWRESPNGESRCVEEDPLLAELSDWRKWQAATSPASKVGIEAVGKAIAYVARAFRQCREGGLDDWVAIATALRPIDRLAPIPSGATVELHNTSAQEILAELTKGQIPALLEKISPVLKQLLTPHFVENICGRLVLNSIRIPSLDDDNYIGVFVILSCMNHDCEPNVDVVMDEGHSVSLVARRAIEEEEELCISYVPTAWNLAERRDMLQHWLFECCCSRCSREQALLDCVAAHADAESSGESCSDRMAQELSENTGIKAAESSESYVRRGMAAESAESSSPEDISGTAVWAKTSSLEKENQQIIDQVSKKPRLAA